MPALALSHTSFPFLSSQGRAPLQWTHGSLFRAQLGSSTLRVGDRGVGWCATCELPVAEWADWPHPRKRLPCPPAPGALCAARVASLNASLVLFPSAAVRVAAAPLAATPPMDASGALWDAAQRSCASGESNRELVLEQRAHAVSLCDLVHDRFDFVLHPGLGELAWRRRDNEDFFYSLIWTALVIVVVLFLFTRVCENLANIIRGEARKSDWHTTLLLLAATVCSFPATARNDFAAEERVLTLVLQVYALVFVAFLFCQSAWETLRSKIEHDYALLSDTAAPPPAASHTDRSVNTTGVLIAVLLLLTAHLQNTYETPFLSVFVIIFGVRSFLKVLNFTLHHSKYQNLFTAYKFAVLLADTFAFLAVLELAVRSAARSSSEYASTAAGLELLSVLGGAFLYQVVRSRRAP